MVLEVHICTSVFWSAHYSPMLSPSPPTPSYTLFKSIEPTLLCSWSHTLEHGLPTRDRISEARSHLHTSCSRSSQPKSQHGLRMAQEGPALAEELFRSIFTLPGHPISPLPELLDPPPLTFCNADSSALGPSYTKMSWRRLSGSLPMDWLHGTTLVFCLFVCLFRLLNTFSGCNQPPAKKKESRTGKKGLFLLSEGTS